MNDVHHDFLTMYILNLSPVLPPRVPVLPCDGVFCGAGRVCVVTEEREPSCQCAEVR